MKKSPLTQKEVGEDGIASLLPCGPFRVLLVILCDLSLTVLTATLLCGLFGLAQDVHFSPRNSDITWLLWSSPWSFPSQVTNKSTIGTVVLFLRLLLKIDSIHHSFNRYYWWLTRCQASCCYWRSVNNTNKCLFLGLLNVSDWGSHWWTRLPLPSHPGAHFVTGKGREVCLLIPCK